jgi:hypothetical protein
MGRIEARRIFIMGLVKAGLLAFWAGLSTLLIFLLKETIGEAMIHWIQSKIATIIGVDDAAVIAFITAYSIPVFIAGLLVSGAYWLGRRPNRPAQTEQPLVASSAVRAPAVAAPAVIGKRLLSTYGKTIYLCSAPKHVNKNKNMEGGRKEIEQTTRAYGDSLGVSIVFSDITDGFKLELVAKNAEGRALMRNVAKWTLEIRVAGEELIVTSNTEYAGLLEVGALGIMVRTTPVDPNSEWAITEQKSIERLIGVEAGQCQII